MSTTWLLIWIILYTSEVNTYLRHVLHDYKHISDVTETNKSTAVYSFIKKECKQRHIFLCLLDRASSW